MSKKVKLFYLRYPDSHKDPARQKKKSFYILTFCVASDQRKMLKKCQKLLNLFWKSANGQKVFQSDPKGLLGVLKGKNRVFVHWHRNSESLREC